MVSNEQLFNSDYLPSILLKINIGEELSDEEWMRYLSWFRASNRNQDNVISQYYAGMLGENTPISTGLTSVSVSMSVNISLEDTEPDIKRT